MLDADAGSPCDGKPGKAVIGWLQGETLDARMQGCLRKKTKQNKTSALGQQCSPGKRTGRSWRPLAGSPTGAPRVVLRAWKAEGLPAEGTELDEVSEGRARADHQRPTTLSEQHLWNGCDSTCLIELFRELPSVRGLEGLCKHQRVSRWVIIKGSERELLSLSL